MICKKCQLPENRWGYWWQEKAEALQDKIDKVKEVINTTGGYYDNFKINGEELVYKIKAIIDEEAEE